MKTKHLRLMQRVYIVLFFCFMYLHCIHDRIQLQPVQGLFALHRLYPQVVLQPAAQLLHPACAAGLAGSGSDLCGHCHCAGYSGKSGHCVHGRGSRLVVTNITYIPVVNPEIITGISLMLLFVAYQRFAGGVSWLPDTIMGFPTLLIAHIAFNVPYVIFNVTPKLKQLDIKLYEAALDLGCDPKQAFFKVILPEISPAILSAFLICLTYSIDDFMISYFNCGTVETLPIAIYSMTRKKVSPEIYALSTIMFVVILCIILISNAMESRSYRRDQKALRGEGV